MMMHIVSTHGDLEAMRAQVRDVYYGCKQGATESISSYQIRFEQAVQVLKEVGETVPSNVQQAHDFIRWLDRVQFSQLQCSLENEVALKGSAR